MEGVVGGGDGHVEARGAFEPQTAMECMDRYGEGGREARLGLGLAQSREIEIERRFEIERGA